MSTVIKVFAASIVISCVAIMSFLAGEVIGMKSGYAHSIKMTTPMDAAYTVSVINLIDNNMIKDAKEMLETKLDTYIVSHWSASQCRLIGLNPFIKEKPQRELFSSTISHRKSNPSHNEIIQAHLRFIEKGI